MDVKLHANATTTPKTRGYIQASGKSVREMAGELGISEATVRRWRARQGVMDHSHTPRNLRISLSPVEEQLVLELRVKVALPFEDIVEVMQRCVRMTLSRSAIYRCLKRHGVAARTKPAPDTPGSFAPAPFGFVHIDLKHLPRLEGKPAYVFVAIERITRFAYVQIVTQRDGLTIAACLERFLAAFAHPVHTILTDNGSEFTDRFGGVRWHKNLRPSGRHPFDQVCRTHAIEHRLTRPFHPQTNGMVERFNRRIAEVIAHAPPSTTNAGKNRFQSHSERNDFILDFAAAYNRTRLRCIGYKAPIQALTNHTEDNTYAGMPAGG
jgi:transposase